jgi:predicted dehydrogenase
MNESPHGLTRRAFVATAATMAAFGTSAAGLAGEALARTRAGARLRRNAPANGRLKVGVIGCGGRGTGAAVNMLEASDDVEIWALGDAFADRLAACRDELAKLPESLAARVQVPEDRRFVGFDAYQRVLASGVDVVILATPPGFRPTHFAAAVDAGKHVFFEKPVAVDPAGVRQVIDSARKASEKKLNVVTGTQRRHERCYIEAFQRIESGAIGRVVSASVFWNQGGLWMNPRQPGWSDMEWQLRNWLYFAWLSGDHIVEQHVHNLDVAAWAVGKNPTACLGMGGRQVRTDPAYGHVFDHFAVEYELPDGVSVSSQCRQIDGCAGRVEEVIRGTEGWAVLASGRAQIFGPRAWTWSGQQENPYVSEHRALVAGITGGPYVNEAERVAHSTLWAIMGRMSAYSGKRLTWKQALESPLDLRVADPRMGPLPLPPVAVPGKTPVA